MAAIRQRVDELEQALTPGTLAGVQTKKKALGAAADWKMHIQMAKGADVQELQARLAELEALDLGEWAHRPLAGWLGDAESGLGRHTAPLGADAVPLAVGVLGALREGGGAGEAEDGDGEELLEHGGFPSGLLGRSLPSHSLCVLSL